MGLKEAKAELKSIRDRINEMNSVQLVNFFKPFSPEQLDRIAKGVERALNGKKQAIINAKKKRMEILRQEISELEQKGE